MPTDTTTRSRLKLIHPDLNYDGGSGLHTVIANLYEKLGDSAIGRFLTAENLADAASVDLEHNFYTNFSELRFVIYAWDATTNELTKLTKTSTPAVEDIGIVAKSGDEKRQITLTNNSGAERDLAVLVYQSDRTQIDFTVANNQAAAADVTDLAFDSNKTKMAVIHYFVDRSDDVPTHETRAGTFYALYDSTNNWRLEGDFYLGNPNVLFSITSTGQIQYTSSNYTGGSYAGNAGFLVQEIRI